MYVLQTISDTVRITPDRLGTNFLKAVEDELNSMIARKIFYEVGLCIAVYDILNVGNSIIKLEEEATYTRVEFRALVFRPQIDEILVGKVKSVSPQGAQITLGFFDDIHIEPEYMQRNSRYCDDQEAWIWDCETVNGRKIEKYLDEGDEVRFRVIEEKFVEITQIPDGNQPRRPEDYDVINVLYSLKGSICDVGLGELGWWDDWGMPNIRRN